MIVAKFKEGENKTYTETCHQFDKGQTLGFEGIEYPENTEVHFSNNPESGIAFAVKIQNGRVKIPSAFLETGEYVYAWLYAISNQPGTSGSINYHFESLDEEDDHLVVDSIQASKKGFEDSLTLFNVVIPVQRRPNIVRAEELDEDGQIDADSPTDMEYEVNDDNMHISSVGNAGNGEPSIQNYMVDGENFVFTRQ